MKRRQRLLCALVLLLCSPVVFCSAAFAANEHWYNVVNPVGIQGIYISNQTQISDYVNLNSSGYWETNSRAVSSDYLTFGFNPNWTLSYSSAYDYWITWQCFAFMDNDISKFSFYPTDFDAEYYDIHTYQWKRYGLENVSFSHLDSYGKAGFSCFAKFPDNFNATIESISAYGSYGTIPANLLSIVQIYQVPKNSDGSSQDTAKIISAIQAQTQSIVSSIQNQTNDLMAVPDEQVQAAEQFVNDSNAQLQEALSPLMAAEQLSGSLVNAFRSKEKYQVYFPGVAGPFMPDGSTVTIIQPQTVDMSFMDRFSIITDAIGVVMLGLCGWKTLDFLYNTLMKILGKEGDES